MLQKQTFSISLAGGIDTKSDDKQVIPGKLLLLENGIFDTAKEIRKRHGNTSFNTTIENNNTFTLFNTVGSTVSNGNFITSFNRELVLNDQCNLFSFSTGINDWIYKGKSTICKTSIFPIIRNTYSQTLSDSAINPYGIQIFAWEDSQSSCVNLSVIDTSTNQIIVNNKSLVSTSSRPKCAYINGRLLVFYIDSAVNRVLKYITYINGIFSSPVTVATDVKVSSTADNYDICPANNNIYIAYYSSGNSIKVTLLTSILGLGNIITKIEDASQALTITYGTSNNVWIGYASPTQVKTFVLDPALNTTILAPTLIETISSTYNITGVETDGIATFFYDKLNSADINGHFSNASIRFARVLLNGSISLVSPYIYSAALQSKAFIKVINGANIPHFVATHDSLLQPTYFLCNLYNFINGFNPLFNVVSKIAYSLGGGIPTNHQLSSINEIDTNIFQTSILQKDLLFTSASSSGTVNTYTQTGVVSTMFNFTETNPNTIVLGNNLHIGSGILGMYDGANVVEHSFSLYPEAIVLVINTSGGALTDSSSYGYQVVYEWTDNQGQLHRSSPSPIISATTGSHSNASQGVLSIPSLNITQKPDVNIVVYRTQANGTVYYRLNLPNNPIPNTLGGGVLVYTDNASDASIGANEQLYTTGGEVPNIAAPASVIMSAYKNRVILIPSDNPYAFWFSKQVIPGSPVEFSDFFVQNVGTIDGEITAVSQLDSNLIIFKENSIYYVSGDGPSPAGTGNDFTDALKIASDVGCVNSQSLVLMPNGIMFKSNKGIYLLERSLQVMYIGAEVEAFNSNNVTSAQLIVDTNQIRFTLDNKIALLYDYFFNQWSVFTNHNAISSTIDSNNLFTYLQPNGLVLQETPADFTDNGNFIKLKLVTSWISMAGIQGYQRIYKSLILGKYFGPHQLSVQLSYDFNPIVTQQDYIDVTTILNSNIYGQDYVYGLNSPYGGEYPLYQWKIYNQRQVCESFQMTIEDVPSAGTYVNNQGQTVQIGYNQSLSLSAISLELGIKRGLNKFSAKRSFG